MKAKIKLTVGEKTYAPGDEIDQKLSPPTERFLLREGYIEQEKVSGKKASEKRPAQSGIQTDAPEKKPDANKKEA